MSRVWQSPINEAPSGEEGAGSRSSALVVLALMTLLWLLAGRSERPRRLLIVVACVVPSILALAASGLGLYPYGEVRLMLFALPGALALLAAGLETFAERWRWIGTAAALLLVIAFAFNGGVRETYNSSYMRHSDTRDVDALVKALWRPGTVIVADLTFAAQPESYHPELAAALVSGDSPNGAAPGPREMRVVDLSDVAGTGGPTAGIRDRVGAYGVTLTEPAEIAVGFVP